MREKMPTILAYIRQACNEGPITSEGIAQHFGYDKYYFSRKFKAINGFSVAEYMSSLKVEKALDSLDHENQAIGMQLEAGFESSGTFSNTFKKYTGSPPKLYQEEMSSLVRKVQNLEGDEAFDSAAYSQTKAGFSCQVSIELPVGYRQGLIFIGLFKSLIPNNLPVAGLASKKLRNNILKKIPAGNYYLLACAMEASGDILSYFKLNQALRGKVDDLLSFPQDSDKHYIIKLREALPEDPPILVNLPRLLINNLNKSI